ncbi:MAG TPA: cytochrome c3 family protein [Candidatus Methanoperedens sp.]|nr:cytochrome c3 family protein [Candidatus Methanoperedens sp.]
MSGRITPPRRALRGLCLWAALQALLGGAEARAAKLDEGQQAATLKGTDFLTGAPLDLEQSLGKRVILLDFGSIYCSSCMVTVPNLIKLRKRFPEEDLAIFNIYLDIYNPQRVVKFFRGFASDIKLNLLIDDKLAISREYGVDTLPTTIIIDRAGVIRRRIVGYTEADEREIDGVLDRLVSELPATAAPGQPRRGEEPFNVFVPESFTKTRQDRVHVVGFIGGAGSRDVSVRLNNLPERVVTAKDGVFHLQTSLSLAMNLIEVKGSDALGGTQSQSVVIFRETPMGGDIVSDLPEYRFHREEEKKGCRKCHALEVPPEEKSGSGQSQFCNACHGSLAKRIFTHGPITVGGCLPCHDYQSFPNRYELRTQGDELCFGCHDRVRDQIKEAAYIHGPVAAGICSVCHDPHGANERFLLVRKADRMCINCHQDMLKEFALPYVHRPILDGSCTGCHDPHAARFPKMLVLSHDTLCSKCHDLEGTAHMHKAGVPAKTEFPPGTPVGADGLTVCYTCHFFHAGSRPKLIRGPRQVCGMGCHNPDAPEEGAEAPAEETER